MSPLQSIHGFESWTSSVGPSADRMQRSGERLNGLWILNFQRETPRSSTCVSISEDSKEGLISYRVNDVTKTNGLWIICAWKTFARETSINWQREPSHEHKTTSQNPRPVNPVSKRHELGNMDWAHSRRGLGKPSGSSYTMKNRVKPM